MALGSCLALAQATRPVTYKDTDANPIRIAAPSALDQPTVTYSNGAPGWRNCTITFSSNLDFAGTNATVELYFDSVPTGSLFDHGVVLPLGSYTYKALRHVSSGQCKVVDMSNYQVIASATATMTQNSVTISYPTNIIGTQPTLIQLRYLPASVPLVGVWDELNGAPTWRYLVPESVIGTTSSFPEVPFESGPVPESAEVVSLVQKGTRLDYFRSNVITPLVLSPLSMSAYASLMWSSE